MTDGKLLDLQAVEARMNLALSDSYVYKTVESFADMPALLAEVKKLGEDLKAALRENAELTEAVNKQTSLYRATDVWLQEAIAQRDALQARIDAMTKAVNAVVAA